MNTIRETQRKGVDLILNLVHVFWLAGQSGVGDMVFVDTDLLVVLENAVERDTGDHFEKGTSHDWRNCRRHNWLSV